MLKTTQKLLDKEKLTEVLNKEKLTEVLNEESKDSTKIAPVVFCIFKRPDTTEKVFEAIRLAKPPKLLVIADGPRSERPGEAQNCAATRAIINRVDWDCEVLTNYSDVNLGCRTRMSSGLDWVFSQVEEAIILEDDCLPHPSFFRFCTELLDYYRNDTRIMTISGDNSPSGYQPTKDSYYFSYYPRIWGWATWRRAWAKYDVQTHHWPEVRDSDRLKDILVDKQAVKVWEKIFQSSYDGCYQTWDYQWTFASFVQSGLTIIPNVNLVSNIGFSHDGTNTIDSHNPRANVPVQAMEFPLQHPQIVIRDRRGDAFTQKHVFNTPSLWTRAKNKVKRILRNSDVSGGLT